MFFKFLIVKENHPVENGHLKEQKAAYRNEVTPETFLQKKGRLSKWAVKLIGPGEG
jgi:hypothetical protein